MKNRRTRFEIVCSMMENLSGIGREGIRKPEFLRKCDLTYEIFNGTFKKFLENEDLAYLERIPLGKKKNGLVTVIHITDFGLEFAKALKKFRETWTVKL